MLTSIIPPASIVLAEIPDSVLDYCDDAATLRDDLHRGHYLAAEITLRRALARMPDPPARAIYLPNGRAIRALD